MNIECRAKTWDVNLVNVVDKYSAVPFKWGEHDCCLFACRAYDSVMGTAITNRHLGEYDDALSAMRHLKSQGYYDLYDAALGETCGMPQSPYLSSRGDIIFLPVSEQYPIGCLGVCMGHLCVFAGIVGLVNIPLDSLPVQSRSFRI